MEKDMLAPYLLYRCPECGVTDTAMGTDSGRYCGNCDYKSSIHDIEMTVYFRID